MAFLGLVTSLFSFFFDDLKAVLYKTTGLICPPSFAENICVSQGTSAPVFIPDMRRSMHNHELSLGNLDEEIEDEVQRSSTFVPPHLLMGEKPLIEFSLNSSMAEKRAHLRARTEILRRTGFIETAATPVQTGWRTRGSSANANMFAHISGAMEKCTKRASALSMKFAPPEKIGN